MEVNDAEGSPWAEFLKAWPIERLRTMTLAEYTTAGNKDCFVYWLEFRLGDYGSIAGGSAFKFWIFSRKNQTEKEGDESLMYNDHYAWYSRLGDTPEKAFAQLRGYVVQVAEAAREGRLDDIDKIELGRAFKWKIAFHYQDLKKSLVACIFVRKPLLHILGMPETDKSTPQSRLYRLLAEKRPSDESIFAYSKRLWKEWVFSSPCKVNLSKNSLTSGYLYINLPSAPFPESMLGGKDDPEVAEQAHFRTNTGLEFDSDILTSGDYSGRIRYHLGNYFKDIGAKQGDKLMISLESDGRYLIAPEKLIAAPTNSFGGAQRVLEPMSAQTTTIKKPPLNQILFGPPGTGKTYHTINKALEILDPALLLNHSGGGRDDRYALKQRFDELVRDARIRFVTFHQSFSYEDFVEGLRADLDGDDGLSYRVEPGVFRSICDAARGAAQQATAVGIKENARIWKISIDGTGPSPTRQYCFAHNEARIGWGEVGDLHDEYLADRSEYQQLGSNDKSTLQAFSREMQHGDVVLCISSATTVQAIGVVAGAYRYEKNVPQSVTKNMGNVLPVHWLTQGEALDIRKLNDGIRFTLKTVYEISRFSWPALAGVIEAAGIKLKGATSLHRPLDHVLIIDEINRGNVSRIFGELITLIEPSKREGASEQLEVVLPYSKTSFKVPASVYVIGTMNTADRSLTGLDIALRRRFSFVEMPPNPELLSGVSVDGVDISLMLERINERIEVLLDRDHQLGHAYFLPLREDNSLDKLSFIFRNQILPLLQEYFFEDWQRIQWVLNDHRKALGDCFVIEARTNVATLFGTADEVPNDVKRWKIDPGAFGRIASYRGIAEAGTAA